MAALVKIAGGLVARTGAVLLALSALAWFVVSAQRDAGRGSPPVAPAAVAPEKGARWADAPVASPPAYQSSSKFGVIEPPPSIRDLFTVESRPVYQSSPYQFSSKSAVIDRSRLPYVLAPESPPSYQPASKAGPVQVPFPSVPK